MLDDTLHATDAGGYFFGTFDVVHAGNHRSPGHLERSAEPVLSLPTE
jgi:hypothetical protein